jgi:integration host factor subunit alpha
MTLTKANLIESIRYNNGISEKQSTELVETIIETLKRKLESGEDVLISGFGKFCVRDKTERRGRNPTTGEDKILPARRVVTFKCSGKLREKINGG